MRITDMTLDLRLQVEGKGVAFWRVRLLRRVARLLGVPLHVDVA